MLFRPACSAVLVFLALLGLAACGPPAARPAQVEAGRPPESKTIVLAGLVPVRSFGIWDVGNAGHLASVIDIHSNALTTLDERGNLIAGVAARLPSFDDGSLSILPDGRLRAVWTLRTDVLWHDGVPLTSNDVVMSWKVIGDPEIPGNRSPQASLMEVVEAVDSHTVTITWRQPYHRALNLANRDFWLLPAHILEGPLAEDKEAFARLPYWTSEYVHLGPFRLVDWGLGETLVLKRFEQYFRGAPKVGTIVLKAIRDYNALFANLRAGEIDIATELSLPADLSIELSEEWRQSGEGVVLHRLSAWRYWKVQLDPQWARPPDLSRDPRIRQALFTGTDRAAIRNTLFPGFEAETDADSFMRANDPRAPTVGKPFARYPFDPAEAARRLAEAGWQRGPDGRLLNQQGDTLQVPVRTSQAEYRELAIMADGWRQLGVDVQEEVARPGISVDAEYAATFPGLQGISRGTGDGIFTSFDSRLIPTPQKRYAGTNGGAYANPALDRLIDQLYGTLTMNEQAMLLKEMGEILATDLPALPLYFRVDMTSVSKGIRAMQDDYTGAESATLARRAYLWDRD